MFINSQNAPGDAVMTPDPNGVEAETRGNLDFCDPVNGIAGWAVNILNPEDSLTIQLLIDQEVIASCKTDTAHGDLADMMTHDTAGRFAFPPSVTAMLNELAAGFGHATLVAQVAETGYVLPGARHPLVLGEMFRGGAEAAAAAAGFDLMSRLTDLRERATELARLPVDPAPDCLEGLIEVAAIDESGEVWVNGWMQRQAEVDGPVVLTGKQVIPAGFAYTFYERDDLETGACGFFGVLHADWRPTKLATPVMYIGDDAHTEVRCITPLRLITWAEFVNFFDTKKDICHTGHTEALQKLMSRRNAWVTEPAGGGTTQAAIEQLLVLPGFGCIVSGWAISASRQIEGFTLKLGANVLNSSRECTYFKFRPDLVTVFPNGERLAARAGFTAVFRGAVALDDLENPILKLSFADGSSKNHAVDIRSLRHLGKGVPLEKVLDLYPSITSESFFPDFASAVRAQARQSFGACRRNVVSPARQVVVLTVPDDRSELFLLFEELCHYSRENTHDFGFAIVAGNGESRSNVPALFSALQSSTRAPCSLFFVDDTSRAFYALPEILSALGARSFVFVGPSIFLTRSGWSGVEQHLAEASPSLRYFEISDPAVAETNGIITSGCFGWTSLAFAARLISAPEHVGDFVDELPLPLATDRGAVLPASAWFARLPISTPLNAAVNRAA